MRTEKIRELKALYDSFEVKDLTWPQFLKEFQAVTNPKTIQRDLASIMSQKQLGRSTRGKIDTAVAGQEM